ncbi:MAG: dephospho-CoA kinase [Pseudomonadales bacterium]|jgi:dephospho-CoA kinase|nr:dephospho-CoA kinase [Pseudomonadales bacterium]
MTAARVLRIGLTGGIASGKSTVANLFAALGVPLIDTDVLAREVVAPGTAGLRAIVEHFDASVLNSDGSLDRAALRARVFADPQERRWLEALTHPAIRALMEMRAAAAGGPYQIIAIPLLAETGRDDRVDRVLVVDCDPALQIARLQARDGSTLQEASRILAAQASREQRLAIADDVITNDGGIARLRDQVEVLHRRYLALAASTTLS